jgi:hypothetical protein
MSKARVETLLREMKSELIGARKDMHRALFRVEGTISHLAEFEAEMRKSPEEVLSDEVEAKLAAAPRSTRELTKRQIAMKNRWAAGRLAQLEKEWNDVVFEIAATEDE